MNKLFVSAAMVLVLASAQTRASSQVSASNFTVGVGYSDGVAGLQLLSDNGSTSTFALTNFVPSGFSATAAGNFETASDGTDWFSELLFEVRDGYRVTSFTVGGVSNSVLDAPAYPPGTDALGAPFAHNEVTLGWSFQQGSTIIEQGTQSATDLAAGETFLFSGQVNAEGDFTLNFRNRGGAEAKGYTRSVRYDDVEFWTTEPATASLELRAVTLTVEVSPVPEPATYGMLLAGLGLLGAVARRRTAGR